jgi:hypothetical protein
VKNITGLVLGAIFAAGCGNAHSDSTAPASTIGTGGSGPPDASVDAGPVGTPLNDAAGCSLVEMGTSGLLIQATLLLPTGATEGDLLVDSKGTIACAAASCATASGYSKATRIRCSQAVVAPGFVNAHDHTTYDSDPPVAHGMIRYQHRNEWRTGADGATALPTQKSITDAPTLVSIELRFLMSGVTSLVGSGGVPGLARNLAAYSDPSQLEGLTGSTVYFDTFPLGDSGGQILTSGCAYPSVISSSSAFSDGVFAPHFAEGINPGAENEIICGDSVPLGLVTNKTAVIHAVGTNAKDVAAIATAGASVVWAPRSNVSLYGDTMPVTEMKYAGVNIALGTDWLPSGSMNELRELSCADAMNGKYFGKAFTDQEIIAMATANAAKAMGFGAQIGSLAAGMQADVVVFATSGAKDFSAPIQASSEDVALVLRGGKALYGDTLLLQAAGGSSSCGTFTVCIVEKSACIDTPNVTLAQVQSIIQSTYPLFSCRGQTPPDEPTCIPYRDAYPNGTSATDPDGDGIAGSSDDCPAVFNPPRSMDADKQSDLDGDGFGDACDARPMDPSSH